jgi:hypothetical protein
MKKKSALIGRDDYTPNHLLDTLMQKMGVRSDAALARALEVPPSTISKIRHKLVGINSVLLLAAHEKTEISIRELRALMGDTHSRYWLGNLGEPPRTRREPNVLAFRDTQRGQFKHTENRV